MPDSMLLEGKSDNANDIEKKYTHLYCRNRLGYYEQMGEPIARLKGK